MQFIFITNKLSKCIQKENALKYQSINNKLNCDQECKKSLIEILIKIASNLVKLVKSVSEECFTKLKKF